MTISPRTAPVAATGAPELDVRSTDFAACFVQYLISGEYDQAHALFNTDLQAQFPPHLLQQGWQELFPGEQDLYQNYPTPVEGGYVIRVTGDHDVHDLFISIPQTPDQERRMSVFSVVVP